MALDPGLLNLDIGPLQVAELRKELDRLLGEMEARRQAGQQRAQEAFGAYSGLASAPPPAVDPREAGVQQLFGDVASVISRRPEFGERSREDIKQRGAMLLQQRIQSIQILRDKYVELSRQAEQVDPLLALKYQEKVDRQNKLLEQMHEKELTTFREGEATKRTQAQVAGGIREAEIAAEARRRGDELQFQATLMGKLGKDEFSKEWNKVFSDYTALKKVGKENRTAAKLSLLVLAQQDDTQESYEARLIEAFKRIEGKKKLRLEDAQLIRTFSAMKFGAPPAPETPAVEAPAPPVAPTGPELIIEAPGGKLPRGTESLVNELQSLFSRMRDARGPSEMVIQQRVRARIDQLVRALERRGVRVTVPAPEIPGVEVEEYSDTTLNRPAQ